MKGSTSDEQLAPVARATTMSPASPRAIGVASLPTIRRLSEWPSLPESVMKAQVCHPTVVSPKEFVTPVTRKKDFVSILADCSRYGGNCYRRWVGSRDVELRQPMLELQRERRPD